MNKMTANGDSQRHDVIGKTLTVRAYMETDNFTVAILRGCPTPHIDRRNEGQLVTMYSPKVVEEVWSIGRTEVTLNNREMCPCGYRNQLPSVRITAEEIARVPRREDESEPVKWRKSIIL